MKIILLLTFPLTLPPHPKKSVWREKSRDNFPHLLCLRPFIDCPPSCLVSRQASRPILRGLKAKDGSFGMSSNNLPLLAEWWITSRQSILSFLFFQTGFYSINCFILTQWTNSKACPNTVFTSAITSVSHTCIFYHRVFCLHWMNSASFAMCPCRANIGSFWLIMTCSRLLEGEGSWQLDHRHKEQITWEESGDTFQPMGNGLSQARGKQEIKTRKQKSHTTLSTF